MTLKKLVVLSAFLYLSLILAKPVLAADGLVAPIVGSIAAYSDKINDLYNKSPFWYPCHDWKFSWFLPCRYTPVVNLTLKFGDGIISDYALPPIALRPMYSPLPKDLTFLLPESISAIVDTDGLGFTPTLFVSITFAPSDGFGGPAGPGVAVDLPPITFEPISAPPDGPFDLVLPIPGGSIDVPTPPDLTTPPASPPSGSDDPIPGPGVVPPVVSALPVPPGGHASPVPPGGPTTPSPTPTPSPVPPPPAGGHSAILSFFVPPASPPGGPASPPGVPASPPGGPASPPGGPVPVPPPVSPAPIPPGEPTDLTPSPTTTPSPDSPFGDIISDIGDFFGDILGGGADWDFGDAPDGGIAYPDTAEGGGAAGSTSCTASVDSYGGPYKTTATAICGFTCVSGTPTIDFYIGEGTPFIGSAPPSYAPPDYSCNGKPTLGKSSIGCSCK